MTGRRKTYRQIQKGGFFFPNFAKNVSNLAVKGGLVSYKKKKKRQQKGGFFNYRAGLMSRFLRV